MKNKTIKKIMVATFVVASISVVTASASELRYRPVNPAFGGNSFNSSFFQGTAETQKAYDAPVRKRTTQDPLEDFSNQIQRRLISRLSSDITEAIFGENAQDSGQFIVGELTLDFAREGELVNIIIQDAASGGETTIALPVPTF